MPIALYSKRASLAPCMTVVIAIGGAGLSSSVMANEAVTEKQALGKRIQQLVNASFTMIEREDYEQTPTLFHYPADYSKDELQRDRCMIAKSFTALAALFGKPENVRPQEYVGQVQHYSIYLRAAGAAYWQQRPSKAQTSFFVDFSEAGPGVVNFQFTDLASGDPRLRSLAYGFEASEESKEKLKKLGALFSQQAGEIKRSCEASVAAED